MPGKYDFPGIRKAGAAALRAVLLSTGWGTWLVNGPLKGFTDKLLGIISEYIANQGLIIINLGAIFIEGEVDQKAFDTAMDKALIRARLNKLTPEEIKALDDEVIKAFRNFARVTRK